MDSTQNWRSIESAVEPQGAVDELAHSRLSDAQPTDRDAVSLLPSAVLGTAVLVALGLLLWATTPQPQLLLDDGRPQDAAGLFRSSPGSATQMPFGSPPTTQLVVDVQGAVVRAGLHRLASGSRVGDAIAAAGGYSGQADLRAAAAQLNLAQPLTDGAKVYVPARGDQTPSAAGTSPPTGTEGAGAGGPIDINSASPAQLDTLPGIGPVTAGKIIAAREEMRFASVDELLARKVVGPATFEKIRTLVTVGP